MKKWILVLALLILPLKPSFAAKDFSLAGKKFKPKNQKILKTLWKKHLKSGGPKKRYYPESSQPTLNESVIYIGTHAKIFYAVNSNTGKIVWKYKNEEPISSTAVISQGFVCFSDLGGYFSCLSKDSGQLIWKKFLGKEILGKPLVRKDTVYILKGEQEVVALSLKDGEKRWSHFLRTYVKRFTMRGHSNIVKGKGVFYIGLADGHLYAFTFNGKKLWSKNLSVPLSTFKDIDASIVVSDDSLYVGGYFGAVYRLHKSSGRIIWKSEVATGVKPLILKDLVIISDNYGSLIALDKSNGKQKWSNELNNSILSAPVQFEDKIFVSSYDKDAFLVESKNGLQLQRIAIAPGSINQPINKNDVIYVFKSNGDLISLGKK